MSLAAVILAAGDGKRMRSRLTKVLHPVAGLPLIHYPIAAALEAGAERIVLVVSPNNDASVAQYTESAFAGAPIARAVQQAARGTGDAARVGLGQTPTDFDEILIACGDTPLLEAADLQLLVHARHRGSLDLVFASCHVDDPTGYGRVLRDEDGRAVAIREQRDLTSDDEHAINEVNAGVYLAARGLLEAALENLDDDNAQGEFYLTDVVSSSAHQHAVDAVLGNSAALLGVNDRAQLAEVEELMFARIRARHRSAGVTIRGNARIGAQVEIRQDAVIEDGAQLRGKTSVGTGSVIDVGVVVQDSRIGDETWVKPYSVITDSQVGANVQIGPFAHLRPDSEIEDEARVGNFVETKKTRLRRGAKANHLAYLGDGDVGEKANVGAGTIFCNYDGFSKARTTIGAGAFIGSDSQIVAPVTIGAGSYVATGTTVTEDVPENSLAIGRTRQLNKQGYAPRLKARLKAAAEAKRAAGKK